MRNLSKGLLCMGVAGMLAGCGLLSHAALQGGGMDMFTPVAVRVHPLSRIVPGSGGEGTVVQGRLEFTDQFKDVGKAAGSATFELFAPAVVGEGEKLAGWTVDLNQPAANHEHWDAITRTYLFSLPVPAGVKVGDRCTLGVHFTLPNGQVLSDSRMLTGK